MLTLAIIPARGRSQGLPGKHLRRIGGEPMIVHTIRAALAARRVDRVLVSTDDPRIARLARRQGAEVPFLRPAELAGDRTPTLPAIRHAVEWVEAHGTAVDLIVTLQATSPLRDAAEIDATIALLDDPSVDSAVTVVRLGAPATVIGALVGGRFDATLASRDLRRQAAPDAVRLTGGVYASRRSLLADNRLLGERPAAFVVAADSAIDVDDAHDLAAARRAMRARHRSIGRGEAAG